MGLLSSLLSSTSKIALLLVFIAVVPGIPPYMEFEAFSVTPPLPLDGPLTLNTHLNNAERLLEGQIHGPEDLMVHSGYLYTTLHGGHVARLVGDKLENIAKFGQPCEGFHEEAKCGRPLGIDFDKHGMLYVADAYYGLYRVNVKTGNFEQLVSINDTIEGVQPKLPNSVTVADDGLLYWTDSSTSHQLQDSVFSILGSGNGRLLMHNPITKTSKVLMDKLHFPNGLALSKDGSFLVVAESTKSRVIKYHLKGAKAGLSEVWLDSLPGHPDNIHRDSKGKFVLSLIKRRQDIVDAMASLPLVRQFLARLLFIVRVAAAYACDTYPIPLLHKAVHLIGHIESLPDIPKYATVLFVNENGSVERSLHATDGLSSISSFVEFEGHYYLGSPINRFIARVKAS